MSRNYTVIQGNSNWEIEADKMEWSSGGAFLLRDGDLVFAGPSAFTTLIAADDEYKEKPDGS